MAAYNQIRVSFWSDSYVENLEKDERYLYLYLLTNQHLNSSGMFLITEKKIAFETDIDRDTIHNTLSKLSTDGKILYDGELLWIRNYHKYNKWINSPKQILFVKSFLLNLPDCVVKQQFVDFFSDVLNKKHEKENVESQNQMDNVSEPSSDDIDTLPIQYGYPSDTVSIPFDHNINKLTTKQINNIPVVKESLEEIKEHLDKDSSGDSSKNESRACKTEQNVSNSVLDKPKTPNEKKQKLTPDMPEYWKCFKDEADRARTFSERSGILPTRAEFGRWKKELAQFTEAGIDIDVMATAIAQMQRDGLTIGAPGSVFKVARSIASQKTISTAVVPDKQNANNGYGSFYSALQALQKENGTISL